MVNQETKEAYIHNGINEHKSDQVEIIFYTDPICCWSWGFEPQWRRLQYEFEGRLKVRYCMAGMLPSWKSYHDELNSVSRPIQMGPVWMHASQISGMPMNTRIWMEDPPSSSYPACIAVKSAQLQSTPYAVELLRMLREAIMLHGRNIAKQDVLIDIAQQLQQRHTGFDLERFEADLTNDNGLEAFRSDLHEVQNRNITRFPTLIMKHAVDNKAIIITGYRPYPVLLDAIKQVAPGLTKTNEVRSANNYREHWKSITETEIAEGIRSF